MAQEKILRPIHSGVGHIDQLVCGLPKHLCPRKILDRWRKSRLNSICFRLHITCSLVSTWPSLSARVRPDGGWPRARWKRGGCASCLLDLIEIGLQIFAGPLNKRECANWCATIFGALDQVVQVGAEFVRGFDRPMMLIWPYLEVLVRRRSVPTSGSEGTSIRRHVRE